MVRSLEQLCYGLLCFIATNPRPRCHAELHANPITDGGEFQKYDTDIAARELRLLNTTTYTTRLKRIIFSLSFLIASR